jgi:predicted transglutaminase-like cysteine proteinase
MNLLLIISIFSNLTLAQTDNLDLEIYKTRDLYPPYADFCKRNARECDLSGQNILKHNEKLAMELQRINEEVNDDILFTLDPDLYEEEEYWSYPILGKGDCEDNALEKRRRLVAMGYPRGALRMATAFHENLYYAHALLLVETDKGTFALDQDNEKVVIWHQAPYIYEARETVDGKWERFYQEWKLGFKLIHYPGHF